MAGAGFVVSASLVGGRFRLFEDRKFARDVARTNQTFAKRMKRSFERTTATWSRPVRFQQKTSARDMSVEVFTVDNIYFWLDEGTSIRYATMSEDFIAKTRPGQLASYPGSGGLAYVNVDMPREGIEARRFAEAVEELHGPEYERAIEEDLDRAIERNA